MKFASAFVAAAAAAHQDALDLLDILGLEDSVVDFFDETALDFALLGSGEGEGAGEEDEADADDAADDADDAAEDEEVVTPDDPVERPAVVEITTPEAVATAVAEVNFVIVSTIGGTPAAEAAPIVGADESTNLSAEAGMNFAVVFETADSSMIWEEALSYGSSTPFMTQLAIAAAVADGDVFKFLASYEVDNPVTNTEDATATLSFTFNGDTLDAPYEYEYLFSLGAVNTELPGMTVNTMTIGGDPAPVVVVEESSSRGFPWLWVILGIVIVGAILYFFVL